MSWCGKITAVNTTARAISGGWADATVLAMANHPRTFQELVDAMDPAERKRLDRDESYRDPAVENDFHADVWLVDDRNASGVWRVEYQDDDGGCYVTIFAGPAASQRARDYYKALRAGLLATIRDDASMH